MPHPPPPLQVIHCIENGLPLLIENLPEEIDAVLDPVIQKKVRGVGWGGYKWWLRQADPAGIVEGCSLPAAAI